MKQFVLYIALFLTSIVLKAQELYVFEQYNNNFTVSKGATVGSYVRAADQLFFDLDNGFNFECQRLGQVIQYKSGSDQGNFKAIGTRTVVYENGVNDIQFEKQGKDFLILFKGETFIISKIGNSYSIEKKGILTEDAILKFGVILAYHLLDGN